MRALLLLLELVRNFEVLVRFCRDKAGCYAGSV
jgi:hypothetical protein